jgi:hypothetical protein
MDIGLTGILDKTGNTNTSSTSTYICLIKFKHVDVVNITS